MKTRHILISAGPTREPLDPVRFLSNRSSGRMGYALAEAAQRIGCRVTLISGPVCLPPPRGVHTIRVETAHEMHAAVRQESRRADIIMMAAAVADYEPVAKASQKIKKGRPFRILRLRRTPDILAELGRRKRRGQVLVGFAAETSRLLVNARAKLKAKNLDYVVANRVGVAGSGFESDFNQATLIGRDGSLRHFPRTTKVRLARRLLEAIFPP